MCEANAGKSVQILELRIPVEENYEVTKAYFPNFLTAVSFPKMLTDLISHSKRQNCPSETRGINSLTGYDTSA